MKRALRSCVAAALVACTSESADSSANGGASGTGGADSGGAGSGGAASATPLTDHERYLLGVWRGTISVDDQTYAYFVLEDGRRGCLWDRHGDDFGQRYFELQFDAWRLVESPLDGDGRMTIELRSSNGETQTIDRYDPSTDNVFRAGLQSMTWQDVVIPCSGTGTNATETGVMRQGIALE